MDNQQGCVMDRSLIDSSSSSDASGRIVYCNSEDHDQSDISSLASDIKELLLFEERGEKEATHYERGEDDNEDDKNDQNKDEKCELTNLTESSCVVDDKSGTTPKSDFDYQPEPEVEPEFKSRNEFESGSRSEVQSEPESKSELQSNSGSDLKSVSAPESEPESKPE